VRVGLALLAGRVHGALWDLTVKTLWSQAHRSTTTGHAAPALGSRFEPRAMRYAHTGRAKLARLYGLAVDCGPHRARPCATIGGPEQAGCVMCALGRAWIRPSGLRIQKKSFYISISMKFKFKL
jgi:hypothetical protein